MESLDKYDVLDCHEDIPLVCEPDGMAENIHPRKLGRSFKQEAVLMQFGKVLWHIALVANLIFLLLNLRIFFRSPSVPSKQSIQDDTFYSPAQEAIAYENRPVDGIAEDSKYAGYPSTESDEAWNALIEGINIKIFPDEMSRLGETSLEINDGTGYLGVLGVYHELHCIKRLRKWFYRDYYYPNATTLEYNERMTHAEHCLEFIRQSSVCHGDITVAGFKWLHDGAGQVVEPTTKEGALHRCVQWDRLTTWAKSRRVDLFDPDLLKPE
ncbi:hypothetical protein E0Z10_g10597 [Xylaria hypoxylon]|uniref:Tat pathway signal sequence n=1 Tax=Xylaria hypoxylon TaxID=37992 RepID=A0A4Z0YFW9_9PEZI|nr:hypothetical protein E0Z10_g10597 [Xylaria hypoxylon]